MLHAKLDPATSRALGDKLRAAREARGFPIETVAHEAGIAPKHLQVLESGSGNPTAATLYRLGAAMGVHPRDLLPDPPRASGRAKSGGGGAAASRARSASR